MQRLAEKPTGLSFVEAHTLWAKFSVPLPLAPNLQPSGFSRNTARSMKHRNVFNFYAYWALLRSVSSVLAPSLEDVRCTASFRFQLLYFDPHSLSCISSCEEKPWKSVVLQSIHIGIFTASPAVAESASRKYHFAVLEKLAEETYRQNLNDCLRSARYLRNVGGTLSGGSLLAILSKPQVCQTRTT